MVALKETSTADQARQLHDALHLGRNFSRRASFSLIAYAADKSALAYIVRLPFSLSSTAQELPPGRRIDLRLPVECQLTYIGWSGGESSESPATLDS